MGMKLSPTKENWKVEGEKVEVAENQKEVDREKRSHLGK